MKSALIATDNDEAQKTIEECLRDEYEIETAADRESCLDIFKQRRHDILFIDASLLAPSFRSPEANYEKALSPFLSAFPSGHIIVMSYPEDVRRAVGALKAGADDYLTYPVEPEEVKLVVESGYESLLAQSELEYLRDQFWKGEALRVVHTLSPQMKQLFDKIKSVAPTKTTVLITGETGTGKGVLAKLIHLHSRRSDGRFISVHCGAIPDTLIESELFGHEKGAFTGAVKRKLGKFEIAQGGAIFLDEIGTISKPAQIKLLQVMQDKVFSRVGGEEELEADVRIIAATNEDLEKLVEAGEFRKDLYYRFNVFPVEVPPLRERVEDIPFLVREFLEDLNKFNTKAIHSVHPKVMEAFRNYAWPGNIRELENLIERAYIIEQSNVLTPESFPAEIFGSPRGQTLVRLDITRSLSEVRAEAYERVERQYLKEQLAYHHGRIDATAAACGITTRQLHKLLKKHNIQKAEFKLTGKESGQ